MSADPFILPGFYAALQLHTVQHPELLELKRPAHSVHESQQQSCADQAMMDEQGLFINPVVASLAANYLSRMLLTKDLMTFATYIDLSAGVNRSKYISKQILENTTYRKTKG